MVKADWQNIEVMLARASKGWAEPLDDEGTAGRRAQDELLDVVRQSIAGWPQDWLPWMLAMRNTAAHRAPMFGWAMMVKEATPPPALASPFPLQPRWPTVEAMAARPAAGDDFGGLMLLDEPLTVMLGLLEATASVVTNVAAKCLTLRRKRQAVPTLLVQSGVQWREIGGAQEFHFAGFGQPLNLVPAKEVSFIERLAGA